MAELVTKFGGIKNFPDHLFGWLFCALMAGYLVFQLTTGINLKIDKLIDVQTRQASLMQTMTDSESRKITLLEKILDRLK